MNDATITAILSLVGTLCGSLGGILASARLINYRLNQLEKRMDEVTELFRRVCKLEEKEAVRERRHTYHHYTPGGIAAMTN